MLTIIKFKTVDNYHVFELAFFYDTIDHLVVKIVVIYQLIRDSLDI